MFIAYHEPKSTFAETLASKPSFYIPAELAELAQKRTAEGKHFPRVEAYIHDPKFQLDCMEEIEKDNSDTCEHSYIFAGSVPEHKRDLETCEKPNRLLCIKCKTDKQIACNSKDATFCPPCEARYRSRVRTTLRLPMVASRPGTVFLMTLTAPGAQKHCITHTFIGKDGKESPNYKCEITEVVNWETGEVTEVFADDSCISCVCSDNPVDSDDDLAVFNTTLAARWNRFFVYLRRLSPEGSVGGRGLKVSRPFEKVQYAKAIEPQKRGALHIHALLRLPARIALTPALLASMKLMAMELGFGHQFDVQVVGEGVDAVTAARYVAKYVSKRNETGEDEIPFIYSKDEKKKGTRHWKIRSSKGWAFEQRGDRHTVSGKLIDEEDYLRISEGRVEGSYSGGYLLWTSRKKVRPPRAWTVSRGWGLTLGFMKSQQMVHSFDPTLAAKMMMQQMWTVFSQQMGIANPTKPQLAITA